MRPLERLGIFRGKADSRSAAEVAAEVRAELEHHLALAAQALEARGLAPEEARREAARGFGDASRIERQCVRIRIGDRTMWQRVHAGFTLLLLLTIVLLAWRGRAAQIQARETATQALESLQAALASRLEAERVAPVLEPVIVRPGDRLTFVDRYNPGLDVTRTVAEDGKVLVPEVGWVLVAGLTREEVEESLGELLRRYFLEVDLKIEVTHPERLHEAAGAAER